MTDFAFKPKTEGAIRKAFLTRDWRAMAGIVDVMTLKMGWPREKIVGTIARILDEPPACTVTRLVELDGSGYGNHIFA